MNIQRRYLLRFTGTSCLFSPLLQFMGTSCLLSSLRLQAAQSSLPVAQTAAPFLRMAEVWDAAAQPRFAAGELLLVDISRKRFDETGIYLYPAWGRPRPYLVSAAADGLLEFRNPGSGALLWTQSSTLDGTFAGKLVEPADLSTLPPELSALRVPALPASVVQA